MPRPLTSPTSSSPERRACRAYEISTPTLLAPFLAQVAVVTGQSNYNRVGEALGIDVVGTRALCEPEWSCRSAASTGGATVQPACGRGRLHPHHPRR
jgi:hypothetical protein